MVGPAPHEVHALRDQGQRRDVSGVPAGLRALGDDEVYAHLQSLLHVRGGADHVPADCTGGVEPVDGPPRRDAHSANEEFHLLLDQDVDQRL